MADLCQIIIIGRVATDLNLTYTPTGKSLCSFNVATGRDEDVIFMPAVCFDKTAENLVKYSGKGQTICVIGGLKQDVWQKDGQEFKKLKIIVNKLQFLSFKDDKKENVKDDNDIDADF